MKFNNQYMTASDFTFKSMSIRSIAMEMINSDTYSDSCAKELWQRFSMVVSNGTAVNLTGDKDELKAFFKWFRQESSIKSDSKEYSKIQSRINRLFDPSYGGNGKKADTADNTNGSSTTSTSTETEKTLAGDIQSAIILLKANGYTITLEGDEV